MRCRCRQRTTHNSTEWQKKKGKQRTSRLSSPETSQTPCHRQGITPLTVPCVLPYHALVRQKRLTSGMRYRRTETRRTLSIDELGNFALLMSGLGGLANGQHHYAVRVSDTQGAPCCFGGKYTRTEAARDSWAIPEMRTLRGFSCPTPIRLLCDLRVMGVM